MLSPRDPCEVKFESPGMEKNILCFQLHNLYVHWMKLKIEAIYY